MDDEVPKSTQWAGDRLFTWDAASVLSKLPAAFVSTMDLRAAIGADKAFQLLGLAFRATAGDAAALKSLLADPAGQTLLDVVRDHTRDSDEGQPDRIATLIDTMVRPFARNAFILEELVEATRKHCVNLVEVSADSQSLMGRLPASFVASVTAATGCIQYITAIAGLSFTKVVQGSPWLSDVCLIKATERLRDARSELRTHLDMHGNLLIASTPGTAQVGTAHYPSFHHAVFSIAGEALDSIALAVSSPGTLIYGSVQAVPLQIHFHSHSDSMAVGKSLMGLPFPDFSELLAGVQKEACIAALQMHREIDKSSDSSLSECELNILEAAGIEAQSGEDLARLAGYQFTGRFREILSSMKKRGLLVAGPSNRGYRRG